MKALRTAISITGILLISICFTFNANAELKWTKYSYFKNYGGLNDNLSTTEIADNEATDIQNIIFDTGGAIKKRFGYTDVTDVLRTVATGTNVCINGICFYKKQNGDRFLVALTNNDGKATLMKKDYNTSTGPKTGLWENIDNAGLSSSYTNNYQPSFAIASDSVVFTDGVNTNKPFIWNGTNKCLPLTDDADVPNGTIVVYHKRQMFITGNDTFPSRVYFSVLDDITQYEPLDFFDVDTEDGSIVRGMIEAFDSLYIFKDHSIWRLAGTNRDDFTLQKMVDGIGTLSNGSIQVVNNMIYFTTAQNDVAIYDGGYSVKFISQKIRGTIGGLSFSRAENTRGLAFSTYKYNDFDYYVSVSTQDSLTNNEVLFWDTAFNAWSKFKGINANCWCVGDDSKHQNTMYFGDYKGHVYSYPSTQYYDGSIATVSGVTTAIVSLYQTKWFLYPEISLEDKYWRVLKTYALSSGTPGFIFADCRADYEASGKTVIVNLQGQTTLWDVALWDVDLWGGQTIIISRSEIEKGTHMFQIRYYNGTAGEGFTIVGFENFIEGAERV